jgi:hypothetical protein
MNIIIRNAFNEEVNKGKELYFSHKYKESFYHFERAHILGQLYVIPHTISHFWMLKIGIKTKNIKEIIGQLMRIPVGILGSAVGIVPTGNTGGANVNALKKMDIPEDLKKTLDHK